MSLPDFDPHVGPSLREFLIYSTNFSSARTAVRTLLRFEKSDASLLEGYKSRAYWLALAEKWKAKERPKAGTVRNYLSWALTALRLGVGKGNRNVPRPPSKRRRPSYELMRSA